MFSFVWKLFKYAKYIVRTYSPDVVIASSTYPLDTFAGQRIAKIGKAKYIHEVHDMWPATLYEIGGMSKANPFVVLMQLAENSAYRKCDELVALLPYSKEYMVIPDLLSYFECTIITGVPSPLYRFGLCLNKMYDSMMAGKPIIYAITSPNPLVREYDCGIQIDDVSPPNISLAISQIKSFLPEKRQKMGQNGKTAVLNHFSYSILGD